MRNRHFREIRPVLRPSAVLIFWSGAMLFPLLAGGRTDVHWPQFRGEGARGIAEGHRLPVRWDGPGGANIVWRTPIPGLGHSSPVVWGNRVFLTTAVRDDGQEPFLRVGSYGESSDNPEAEVHHFNLMCLDKNTGEVLWERTARSGVPQVMRHIKSSHATSTPSTDGKHVVAFFGSEGLYCYDIDGNPIWEKDLGFLDAGAFDAPEIRWGFGSSAVVFRDRVLTLCDVNNQSFIAAFRLETGEEIWRTMREEVPTWGSPTVVPVDGRHLAVVNGWHRRGAYDADTGEEIWWMDGGGDIPVPTPFAAHDLVFFSSAHGRLRPLYAIRPDARGEISLGPDETSGEYVVWSHLRRGAYIPTPIVYGTLLYVLQDNGALTCYRASTGETFYRERAGGVRGSYSASPVAGDGKVYCTSEYGDIHVIRAGEEYRHLATNSMGEICMATPAISEGRLYIRTHRALYAVEDLGQEAAVGEDAAGEGEPAGGSALVLPAGELNDPREILKWTNAASQAVRSVKYTIQVEVEGALKAYSPGGSAAVTAEGHVDGWPEKFLVEWNTTLPGMEEAVSLLGGSDGDRYYVVDPLNQKVHADFGIGVMGGYRYAILGALVREFHIENPFGEEMACGNAVLAGVRRVGGESCYEVVLDFQDERERKETLLISKKNFLPVGRVDTLRMPDGREGSIAYTIKELVLDPQLPSDFYAIVLPEGYERTDEPLQ